MYSGPLVAPDITVTFRNVEKDRIITKVQQAWQNGSVPSGTRRDTTHYNMEYQIAGALGENE